MGVLGAMLGSSVGGLIGGATAGREPTMQTVHLDPETKKMVQAQAQEAMNTTPESIAAKYQAGVPLAQAQMSPQLAIQREQSMGGPNSAMAGAIERKYQGQLGGELEKFKQASNLEAIQKKNQMMQSAAQVVNESANIRARAQNQQVMSQINADRARSQVLQQILGVGGQLAGVGIGYSQESGSQNMPTATQQEVEALGGV